MRYAAALFALSLAAWEVPASFRAVAAESVARDEAIEIGRANGPRRFDATLDGRWIGQGIAYGPYRKGQSPGADLPVPRQLLEDMELISQHWNLIRTYGASEFAESVLKIIHQKQLPIRVMLGAWITRENDGDGQKSDVAQAAMLANQREVREAIRLANAYPDEVIAVSVGNETQVFWSDHQTSTAVLVRHIRSVRESTSVPVTTADDFNYWNKPESKVLAREIDFIVTHIHPMWAGVKLPDALPFTQRIYAEICDFHPEKMVVIGETGWATQVHDQGEQAKLIKGKAGELQQQTFYCQFAQWSREAQICSFYFEAFDEPWKGGAHPDEVEKNWGVFRENRKPKLALSGAKR